MASVLDPTLPKPTMPTLTSCISYYDISGISWSCRVARLSPGGSMAAARGPRTGQLWPVFPVCPAREVRPLVPGYRSDGRDWRGGGGGDAGPGGRGEKKRLAVPH